jgi:hypothetical protein
LHLDDRVSRARIRSQVEVEVNDAVNVHVAVKVDDVVNVRVNDNDHVVVENK